ncbi:unnamed protein product [Paramecium octaurelia]|uniref:Tetratricopeptide repeat protein n=1 Tax=Paramecium octaurelia TaxID=43137 RepID=A0A8S1S593_PAROT|nr:unnamed protein product [Paramecium octaurelia]
MDSDIQLSCRYSLHNNEQIQGFCPYPKCNNFRLFCINCLLQYHCDHAMECKNLKEFPQWSEQFNNLNLENTKKLESILEIFPVLKSFKEWYEAQYYPVIYNQSSVNTQQFEQKINNMINIQQITTIIDQSIKPQIEKLKIYLEYIMNQTGKINNLVSFDEFIQSRLQTTGGLNNRAQKNFEEANSLYWAGRYEDCIQKCNAFQKFHITDIRFSLMKGDSYLELKKFEDAIENYMIAIDMDENNYYAIGKIGDINLNTGKLEEALKCYDQCTRINDKSQEYYFKKGFFFNILAKIYQKLKQLQQSLECVDHVLLLNSSHIEALQMKAVLLQLISNKSGGIQEFQQNLQATGANMRQILQHQLRLRGQFQNQTLLGQILSEDEANKQFQRAFNQLEKNPSITLQICREILEKDKTNFQFVILSAYAMKNLGKYQEALHLCEFLNKLDPNNQEIEDLQQIIYGLIQ